VVLAPRSTGRIDTGDLGARHSDLPGLTSECGAQIGRGGVESVAIIGADKWRE